MRLVLVAATITRIEARGLRTRRRTSLGRRGWSLTRLDLRALLRLSYLASLGLCLDLSTLLSLGSLTLLSLCLNLGTLLGLGRLPLLRARLDLRALLGLLSLALLSLGSLPRLRPGGLLLPPRLLLRPCALLPALLRLRCLSLLRLFPSLPGLLLPPLLQVRLSTLLNLRALIGLDLALPRLFPGAVSLLAGADLCITRRQLARLCLLLLA